MHSLIPSQMQPLQPGFKLSLSCRTPVPASDPVVAVTCMLLSSEDLTGKQQPRSRQATPGMAAGDGGDEDGGLGDDDEEVVLVDDPAAAAPDAAQPFAAGQKVQLHEYAIRQLSFCE